jgi:hypothetical protein
LNEIKPYIEISKPKLRNNLKQLFAMKKIILILTIIPCLVAAQEMDIFNPMGLTGGQINISAHINGGYFTSIYDDRVKWELWVEPTKYAISREEPFEERAARKGIDQEYIEQSKSKWSSFVEHAHGKTFAIFDIQEPGYYHFSLIDKNNGQLLAYVMVVMDKDYLNWLQHASNGDHRILLAEKAPGRIDWGPSLKAKGVYEMGLHNITRKQL